MLNRRKLLSAALGVSGMQLFPAFGNEVEYDGPNLVIRLSHFAPQNHPLIKATTGEFIKEVEEETGGRIKFKTYYGGVLHGAKDGFKAATSDIVDVTPAYVMYSPTSFHLMHVLDLPFAFHSASMAGLVATELYSKYFRQEYEAMGVYRASATANGAYNLFTKRPVTDLKSLKGLKIRSGGGVSNQILTSLGATPVAVAVTEAYTAFQRGVVDGVLVYNTGAVAYRINEIAKHMTKIGVNYPANAWAWNPKTWDNLPSSAKHYLSVKFQQHDQLSNAVFDAMDKENEKRFASDGMAVHTLEDAEMKQWVSAVEPLWQKFVEENETAGRPAKDLVEDLRKKAQAKESWTPDIYKVHVERHPLSNLLPDADEA